MGVPKKDRRPASDPVVDNLGKRMVSSHMDTITKVNEEPEINRTVGP